MTMTTSFSILPITPLTNFPVQNYSKNNENITDRTSTDDNDRLRRVTVVFEYLKNIQPTFYQYTQNLLVNNT
jgi:hypothetical protein